MECSERGKVKGEMKGEWSMVKGERLKVNGFKVNVVRCWWW